MDPYKNPDANGTKTKNYIAKSKTRKGYWPTGLIRSSLRWPREVPWFILDDDALWTIPCFLSKWCLFKLPRLFAGTVCLMWLRWWWLWWWWIGVRSAVAKVMMDRRNINLSKKLSCTIFDTYCKFYALSLAGLFV